MYQPFDCSVLAAVGQSVQDGVIDCAAVLQKRHRRYAVPSSPTRHNPSINLHTVRCMSMREAAALIDGGSLQFEGVYDGWDADMIYGCVCDEGWEGYDCSLRWAKNGGVSSVQRMNDLVCIIWPFHAYKERAGYIGLLTTTQGALRPNNHEVLRCVSVASFVGKNTQALTFPRRTSRTPIIFRACTKDTGGMVYVVP